MPLANEIERPCCVRRCSNIMINGCRWSHGAVGWITQTKRSLKNNYMDTSGMTPEKFWHQNFFPPVGLPLNKILKNCWRAPWPARRPEILHAGHWPQYATFIFYTNFCAMKFLLIRFLKNALRWVYGSGTMVGEGGPEGDTAPHNYRGLIFGQNNLIRS